MNSIGRNLGDLAKRHFDIIVVGGGIQGACMALEASRRGLRVLLLERDDFGGATSWNSLRIIHGGLRYLQHADLSRFQRSVAEQAWWLSNFPDMVEPLSCLMPLYERGLRRRNVMRAALAANDWLASRIRKQFASSVRSANGAFELPRSQVIDASATRARFSLAEPSQLRGGALWFDAVMTSPQRLLVEVLRWAVGCGAEALNYVEYLAPLERDGQISGVLAQCRETNTDFEFHGDFVVNCAGPWCHELQPLASGLGRRRMVECARAFNIVVDRAPISRDALAITPPTKGAQTYFCVPYGTRMLIGTMHLPPAERDLPDESELSTLLTEINAAIPRFEVTLSDISTVLAGRLPPVTSGSHLPQKSPTIRSPRRGYLAVEGVKYTTARHLAERTLRRIARQRRQPLPPYIETHRPAPSPYSTIDAILRLPARELLNVIQSESVLHIDDLLLRRIDNLVSPNALIRQAESLMATLDWGRTKQAAELKRLMPKGNTLPRNNQLESTTAHHVHDDPPHGTAGSSELDG